MLNGKQIREVTAQGVRCVDENNVEQFIDFAQCYENYVNERLSPENWESHKKWNSKTDADWDEYVTSIKKYKYVGFRNIDERLIEFFTQPRTKFKFDTKDEWHNVIEAIRIAKYRTIDLS